MGWGDKNLLKVILDFQADLIGSKREVFDLQMLVKRLIEKVDKHESVFKMKTKLKIQDDESESLAEEKSIESADAKRKRILEAERNGY